MKDFSIYKLNVKPSPRDPRDWKASAIYPKITLPEELDLRPAMFKVRDQGDQGSCVAMGGAAMKEWQEVKDVQLAEYMSPQFIYNNREDPDEEGMYGRDLMQILQKIGICRESLWSYGRLGHPSEEAYDDAKNFIIQNYAQVDTVEALKTALYKNGVCGMAVPVYNFEERMWFGSGSPLGGHWMAVCGYLKEGFIIRNSWGEDWGDDGYCIFPYADWGMQWEQWTSIDADSFEPEPVPPIPVSWFKWWYVPIVIVIVIVGYFILR